VDQAQMNSSNESYYKTACGGNLKDPTKYPSAMYRGERVYFCSKACLHVFRQNPDRFMAGDIEHPIDND
jgi:YHS domain-containing protein